MPATIAADFNTRREAEMTVEHLVQEHGIDPAAISILPTSARNSAGTETAGSDTENGGDKAGAESHPALAGTLRVSVEAEASMREPVLAAFASFGGTPVS